MTSGKIKTCIDQDWLAANPEFKLELEECKNRHIGSKDRAHPYRPGSGPAGQSCGTCGKLVMVEYHNKTYCKCGVLRGGWTHGPGTDIRQKDEACLAWEARIDKVELIGTLGRV